MVRLETENTWSYYNGEIRNREYLELLQWCASKQRIPEAITMVSLETESTWSYYNGEIRNRILGAITMVSLETENT
jgi:7-cyano-7-deazaguanine synthase in queuosine biosynthesis